MSFQSFHANSPRTIGIVHSRHQHPYPYPRSPPVPLLSHPRRTAPPKQYSVLARMLRTSPTPIRMQRRVGWQARRRQELVLDIVNGHPELVPMVIQPQQPIAFPPGAPSLSLSPEPSTVLSATEFSSQSSMPTTASLADTTAAPSVSASQPTSGSMSSPTDAPTIASNFGAYDPDEPSVTQSSSAVSPNRSSSSPRSSSAATHAPQFYVALVVSLLAAIACVVAILAFVIRRRGRQRRNAKVQVPWDAGSSRWSASKPPMTGIDEEAIWQDHEKRGGVGEPRRSRGAWELTPSSFFKSSPRQGFAADNNGTNLAGLGIGRVQVVLPKPPTPIPTTTPFVDIPLSPAPPHRSSLPRPPLEHNGTLMPVPTTAGDLKVANYVQGDGASLSSSSTTPSTTPQQSKNVVPLEGLPTPYELLFPPAQAMQITDSGVALPAQAVRHAKPASWDHDMFGTPKSANQALSTPTSRRIIDRLRARQATSPNVPGSPADNSWSGGWRAALSFVSPYLYSAKAMEQPGTLTPVPKRVAPRGRNDGYVGGELVGLPFEEPVSASRRAHTPKEFKVGKLSRSGNRPSIKRACSSRSSTPSGLGIYGLEKSVFTLNGGDSDEEREVTPRPLKRTSRVKGPRSSKVYALA